MVPKRRKRTSTTNRQGSKRRRTSKVKYTHYYPKVLNEVHSGLSLSKEAMIVMDDLMDDIFKRIASEASTLMKCNRKVTLTSRDIQTATRMVLPRSLADHAVSEGVRAIVNFTKSK